MNYANSTCKDVFCDIDEMKTCWDSHSYIFEVKVHFVINKINNSYIFQTSKQMS